MAPRKAALLSSLIPNMSNKTLDHGRLRFKELLGEGGYGVVYRAVDETSASSSSNPSPKEYAIKIIVKAGPDTRRWRCQRREIAVHKALSNHPNILTLHQVIEDDWFIYLVLDYCPGGDLFGAVVERHMYCGNDELVKKVFVQILDAVHFCHEQGIFHRDLKPDNILCNKDGTEVVLGDFGMATDDSISETYGCGSSFYMSPECIGEEFHFRPYSNKETDIWALGITLTNMIAGRNPWNYATTDDQCFLRFMANPEYLREMLPISKSANNVLRRMLTFDARTRISIPELREEILNIDTFFMTREDIAKGNKFVKIAAATYAAPTSPLFYPSDIGALCDDDYLGRDLYADELRRSSRSILCAVCIEDRPNNFVIVDAFGTRCSTSLGSHSSSGDESEGPITPETHAQDSVSLVEVPDMLEGEDMGISVVPVAGKDKLPASSVNMLVEPLEQVVL